MSFDAAMRLAVEQAERVKGATYPNPPVGAVILDRDGEVVGVGATEPAGGAHAEVVALRRAGDWRRAAPPWSPWSRATITARTPPCVDALVAAGISSVVYAVNDPNPAAAGGAARLAGAGVEVIAGVLADEVAGGTAARVAAQAAHRAPACHMEIRHQRRRSQRRGRRQQSVDHQRGRPRRRASPARGLPMRSSSAPAPFSSTTRR